MNQGHSQTGSTCNDAIDVLTAVESVEGSSVIQDTLFGQQNVKWYSFVATETAMSLELRNIGIFTNRIDRLALVEDCNNINVFLAIDFITDSIDTALVVSYSNLVVGKRYYILVGGKNLVSCNCGFRDEIPYLLDISGILGCINFPLNGTYVPCISCSPAMYDNDDCQMVCNGKFEYNAGSTANGNGVSNIGLACGWYRPTAGTSDYYNAFATVPGMNCSMVSVPCNYHGYQPAYSGQGYSGIWSTASVTGFSTSKHEYIATNLRQKLVLGQTYSISVAVSIAENHPSQNNTLQVAFFNNFAGTNNFEIITTAPSSVVTLTGSTPSAGGWVVLSGTYTPVVSGQQTMIVGYFNNYTSINSGCIPNNASCFSSCISVLNNPNHAYMYIDDVSLKPIPNTSLTINPNPVCYGNSINATATGGTNYTFSPSIPYNGSGTGTYPSIYTFTGTTVPPATTTYSLTTEIAGLNGCNVTSTQMVTVNPLPVISTSNPTSCSTGACVTINANSTQPVTYNWSTGQSGSSISVCPITTTSYTVTGTNPITGCSATKTSTVTVAPVTVSLNSATICQGQTATLVATTTPSSGLTYLWSNGAAQTLSSINVNPVSTTTYTVTATSALGCSATASATVTVNPLPATNSNFTLSATSTCLNSPITVTAQQVPVSGNTYTYTYNFGAPGSQGNIITNSSGVAQHSYTSTGTYTVSLTQSVTNSAGCSATSVTTNTIIVVNLPSDINYTGLQKTTCEAPNSLVTTNVPFNPNYTYTWTLTSGNGVTITPQAQANSALITMINPTQNITICLKVSVGNCSFTTCQSIMYCCSNGTVLNNPTISTALAPGNYTVNGTLTVATPSATWNNVNITMNPNSKIVFSGLNTLTINNSNIHGCKSMWQGILINNNGATINTNTVLIEDALKAINVVGKGTLNINKTWFNKNRIGVELNQTLFPMNFTSSCFISVASPSMATVAAALPTGAYTQSYLPTFPSSTSTVLTNGIPERGINIIRCEPNTINFTNRNLFQYVFDGIYTNATSMDIYYCDFQRVGAVGGAGPTSAGIHVVGITNASTPPLLPLPTEKIVNIGDRNNISRKNNFLNCKNGVFWYWSTVGNIASNDFTNTSADAIHLEETGVHVIGPVGFETDRVNILGNKINNVMKHGVYIFNYDQEKVRIISNQIYNPTASYRAATAIRADFVMTGSSNQSMANTLYISENDGTNAFGQNFNGIGIKNMYKGVVLNNFTQAHIVSNKIETYPAPSPSTPSGVYAGAIEIANCNGVEIANNKLRNTTPTNEFAWWLYGILAASSPNSKISCNDIATIGVPMQLKGQMPSDIYANKIQDGIVGIWLTSNGFIGNQDNPNYPANTQPQDNKWGSFTNGAILSGLMLDTYSSGDASGFLPSFGSNIYYRSGSPATWFPQYNASQGPSNQFTPILISNANNPDATVICNAPVLLQVLGGTNVIKDKVVQNAHVIINDQIDFGANNVNARGLIKHELYKQLRVQPELRTNNPDLASFYDSYSSSTFDKQFLVDSLIITKDSMNTLTASIINGTLSQNTDIEQTHTIINQVLINKNLNGHFTEADFATARTIAPLCPFTHGKAVYQARAILGLVDSITYLNDCEIASLDFIANTGARIMNVENDNAPKPLIGIYPNPANDMVTCFFGDNSEGYSIEIVNLLGEKQNISINLKGDGIVEINTHSLVNGTYICKVIQGGVIIQNEKLVIVK